MADRVLLAAARCCVDRVFSFTRLHFPFPSKLGLHTLGAAPDQQCILFSSIACTTPCNTGSFLAFHSAACYFPCYHVTAFSVALLLFYSWGPNGLR
jgi:hypothetical protein